MLANIIWRLPLPSTVILAILCLGVVALLLRRSRGAALVVACVTLFLAVMAWTPASSWLLRPLENRFVQTPLPARITGIIVLGGAFAPAEGVGRRTVPLNSHAERMTAFVGLARRFSGARLVFTGGAVDGTSATEAQEARRFFVEQGVDLRRIRLEDKSRNTHDNAVFSQRLVQPKPQDRWVLVTSAADMPRAMGCFQAIGWTVIPFPVDYHTHDEAWSGLVYYRIRGWTPSLFPAP